MCSPKWCAEAAISEGPENDYRKLVNELMRLMLARQLFTFVTAKPAVQPPTSGRKPSRPGEPTTKRKGRCRLSMAEARKTGRTSKTIEGARRKTILTSVLESLRLYLPTYTLTSVIDEVKSWLTAGRSCFTALLEQLKLKTAKQSVLDRVLPNASG